MCGICGEFKFTKKSFDNKKLDNLMSSISMRGKDSSGTYLDDDIFLGHHRLAIIDTSIKSNQPMQIGKHVIVFNGVIFNYPSIKKDLERKGHTFKSAGDTEVIIRSYIEYGAECVKHLDGVFAFCIYNMDKKSIFLARDRIGIKPLYYLKENNQIIFSSHMKGIIQNMETKEINPIALNYQFTLHSVVPAPHTIIKNIKKLEPGCTLTISKTGEINKERYFDINNIQLANYSTSEIKENVSSLLSLAIEKRINIADVPVGILLSGGLDSSLITAISKEYKEKINTYSIGFETINYEEGNEFYYSDIIANNFETVHEKYKISDHDLLTSLDEVISNMSEPMFSQDSSAFYLLSRNVSNTTKVVMSGQGADEVFGGYFWYKKIMDESNLDAIDALSKYYFDRSYDNYKTIINNNFVEDNYVFNDIKSMLNQMDPDLNTLDKIFRLELSMFIIDDPVKRVDNMTMSHALEARVPYLDIDLIKFMLSVKSEKKIANGDKYLLKQVSEKYLTNEIINREKFYFPVPPLKIIKDKFFDYCKATLNSEAATQRNLFNNDYIANLLENPNNYFTNLNGNELWHFTLLERWLQLNIDP
mgnify:FL=1